MGTYNIIIVDDNKQFRDGLRFYLENILGHTIIAEASSGKQFLKIENAHEADLILMDISMPDLSGMEVSKLFLRENTNKIIAITSYEEKTYLTGLIEAGIKGCVFKKDIHDRLKKAIEVVMDNKLYYPKNISIK